MNNKSRLIYLSGGIILLCAIILTVNILCRKAPEISTSPSETISDAVQLYSNAVSNLNTDKLRYHVVTAKEAVVGSEVFTQNTEQTVTYENLDSAETRGIVQETLTIGNHTVQIQEVFADGIGYFTVENSQFCSPMEKDAYISRYAPAVLMDITLYNSICGFKTSDNYTIEFTKASALESWLWDQNTHFISASGSAVITGEGQLLQSTYNATYQSGQTYIRLSVTVDHLPTKPVEIPVDLSQYQTIAYIDAPKMLEIACGHLLESVSVTSHYTDSILCHAFGDHRTLNIDVHTVNASDWSSRIDSQTTLSNNSKTGTSTVIEKTELFTDGKYSIRINDSEPTENPDIDAQDMKTLCQDILVGTIMLPQHIIAAELEESNDTLVIHFIANEEFAQLVRADACTALYQDVDILNRQTQTYATQTATCYLTIDKTTGLPLSSGFQYVGNYIMDALPYPLEFKADQQYELIGDHANRNINPEQ